MGREVDVYKHLCTYLRKEKIRLAKHEFVAVLNIVRDIVDGSSEKEAVDWGIDGIREYCQTKAEVSKLKKEFKIISSGALKFIDERIIEEKKELRKKLANGAEGYVNKVSTEYTKHLGLILSREMLKVIRESAKYQLRGKSFKESSLDAFESIRGTIAESEVENTLLTIQYVSREIKLICEDKFEELEEELEED